MKESLKQIFEAIEECEKMYNTMRASCNKSIIGREICDILEQHSQVKEYIIYEHRYKSQRWEERFRFRSTKINALKDEIINIGIENIVDFFNDGVDYDNVPPCAGLYFIGDARWNPKERRSEFWVKIGKSTNLKKRMASYNTCCPVVWHIDFSDDYDCETYYHNRLEQICLAKCNHNNEWFMVDEETYNKMCEEGFEYFN